MQKKLISIILLAVFILACVMGASCGGDKKENDAKNDAIDKPSDENGGGEKKADDAPSERDRIIASYELPEENFGGYEFTLMMKGERPDGSDYWDAKEINADEENGETLNDAVYKRNREIEAKYNITIKGLWVPQGSMVSNLQKAVKAGDSVYDAVLLSFNLASQSTRSGYLHNLKEAPYVDLSRPWWDQSIMAETSVKNKTYYAASDANIMDKEGTWTLMFNKKMIADFGLENPYTLVQENKWTFDKFIEMTKDISADLDGDGEFGKYDRYGFATTTDSTQGLLFASGLRIIRKDADDIPYFALNGDDVMPKLEKIAYIMRGDNIAQMMQDYTGTDTHLITQASFEENRALFYAEVMQCVIRLRQMDTDFGIIPLPKWDQNQPAYHTNIHQWACNSMAIPSNVENLERSGLILEAIAHGGAKYIRPAYYDVMLKTKFSRDEESSAMLDIIFASRSADIGYIDNVGSIVSDLQNTIQKRENAFVSTFEKRAGAIEKDLSKIIEAYENLS
ncbi:MAG: extracellular solute-binding protein [Oscillospiraceae bacterium]|nr:extracellular solute-binding protein [Oscillospiraceae bacterium]